jgi:hypothetical protein
MPVCNFFIGLDPKNAGASDRLGGLNKYRISGKAQTKRKIGWSLNASHGQQKFKPGQIQQSF